MRQIFKYQLEVKKWQTLILPVSFKPLTLQVQAGVPCMWAEVETTEETASFTFGMFPTGHIELPNSEMKYLGTVQMGNGSLVFHYYLIL
jgi:hypothetical protein